MDIFNIFDNGRLVLPSKTTDFNGLKWNAHPTFKGVSLKHIVTAQDTGGAFSYHLVKVEPGCKIGNHVHATQLETHEVIAGSGTCINDGAQITYTPGTISIIPAAMPHEVTADDNGLYLFAKFMPALC
jgi:quercetin dioxygenase-like cupin family protein